MSRGVLCLCAALLLGAAGTACTSLETGQAEAQAAHEGTLETPSAPKARAKSSRKTLVYRNAFRICTVFNVKEMATYYGVPRKPQVVARAHAVELYSSPGARREAVRGCLAALRKR